MAGAGRRARSRSWLALAVGLALATSVAPRAGAEKDGIDSSAPAYFDGTVGCGSPELGAEEGCHANPASDDVQVAIQGPGTIALPGGEASFTAMASCSPPLVCAPVQGGQWGAGINVLIDAASSTSDCQLAAAPTQNADQLVREGAVLTHRDAENPPPLGSVGVYAYQFLLTDCTTPGTVRLLVAMNTFNFDGESTGDAWNQTETTVLVPEPAGVGWAALLALAALAGRPLRRG